MKKAG